ncbi:Cof-type HAD-IIB family hydrolase [Streptomyces sp. NBC_01335]|uniref:Cof-type HAD-IIB family hydrolase n=1 Tax=Streptomyces sp. NBC_01335 TaxID=2903828 RepID=UPI002E142BD7|nr:Cof-type HAD-IIB family hydrolase [Streptomyces sp. NBC_01335]
MSTRHDPRPPAVPDIRLIVTDMDGTLLDADGNVPVGLWPLLEELGRRGIVFSPASGRQYATLAHLFEGADEGMVYIAENGALVVRDGVELSSDPIDPAVSARLVTCVRQLAEEGRDVGVVVCGKRSAYTERGDEAFLAQVAKYYRAHRVVDDATSVDDEIIKVAVLDFGGAENGAARALEAFSDTHQVVVSGELWIDVMNRTADKGAAVRRLQQRLGIGPEQTMVFGDYLNDLEMLDTADWSFAMANAHPDILRRARHTAPAHTDEGVLRTIKDVLGI